MPILCNFEYHRPKSLNKAIELLASCKGPAILAGGTDLLCNLKNDLIAPKTIIDIKEIKVLKKIRLSGKRLEIGSLVTYTELIESDVIKQHFPVIRAMAKSVASVGIRNRATMVGNICSAVPCMDSGPVLLAYDCNIKVTSEKGDRVIPIKRWFKAPRVTALRKKEIVKSIKIKLPTLEHKGHFAKLGRYKGEDLAQANLAILLFGDEHRVCFGSVGPVPIRAKEIETLLNENEFDSVLLEKCFKLIKKEISPITDIRATKEYRLHMSQIMFKRGIKKIYKGIFNE